MKLMVVAGIAAGTMPAARRAVAQPVGVDSGGVGLLRWDFEAAYGAGTDADGVTTYSNVDIGVPGATMYAQYRGDVVDHLEVRWSLTTQIGGVDWQTAYESALFLLPVDAIHRDQFRVPSTPEGPIEFVAHTYESAQLNEAHGNLGRLLVIFQRRYVEPGLGRISDVVVPAVTITMAEVPQ